jgi:2-methylisocitrate lyase-like PEP mutase family enzyme
VKATREGAERLRELHYGAQPLVLLNVWDGTGARIVESLGFPVVATTSAGISYAAGVADGALSREAMLAQVAMIANSVNVPVTADMQGGFGQTVADAVATARGAIEAGAVGLNFEDLTHEVDVPITDLALQVERIRAMRATADGLGIPLFINARTDAMHIVSGTSDERLGAVIERGRAFFAAGADGLFVPMVREERLLARLVAESPGPVNVLAHDTGLPVARLFEIGVRRISTGGMPYAHVLAAFRHAGRELLEQGTFSFSKDRLSYEELNEMFGHLG